MTAPPRRTYTRAARRRITAWAVLAASAAWLFGGMTAINNVYIWYAVLAVLCTCQLLVGVNGWMDQP